MPNAFPATLLMTADTIGGVWTYVLELARGLAPHGTRVHLATLGAPLSAAQRQQVAALPHLTLHESTFQLEWMAEPWADVAATGEWLLKLCQEVQPDLVHLNTLVHGHLPWGRPALVVVHSCVLSWWQAVKGEPAPAAWDAYRAAVRRSLQAADLVVAPTAALLAEAAELYGPFRQQAVVPNGLAAPASRTVPKEPFVLALGRVWDEAKNLALLAEAAAQLPWPVYLAGEARHPVTGQAVELPNVYLLGPLPPDEVADWLARAAIYALPARYEPFGLSLLEAAQAGCALVAGDLATLREVWADAALYVSPQSADELAAVINQLIDNETLRREIATRAARRAARYTTAHFVGGYGQLYQRLLASPVPA